MPKITKIPLCPTTRWVVSTAERHGVVVLQLDFIATPEEDVMTEDHSPHYVLSADDARDLASSLQEAARKVGATERRRFPRTLQ